MKISTSSFSAYKTLRFFKVFLSVVVTVLLVSLDGCQEDPSILGRDILPSEDNFYVKIDSSVVINAYTITGKNVVTSLNQYLPIGSLKDSIFGFSTAGMVAQYLPISPTPPNSIVSIDSFLITLNITRAYGDTLTPQTVRIYGITETLPTDTLYYSDFDVNGKYDLDELGSSVFSPDDSTIKIRITNENYLNRFFVLPDSVYERITNFTQEFKGFYIRTDNVTEGGGYAIINPYVDGSKIEMYYNGSLKYSMYFSPYVPVFSVFTNDYENYPVSNHLDQPGLNDSILFIEGLAGVSVRLSFPQLDTFLNNKRVAINKATLIIPADFKTANISENNFPSKLMLFRLSDNGEYNYLYDYKISSSYYDGTYYKSKKAFIINIGLHLQNYLDRKIENSDLILVSYSSSESPERLIIKGTGSLKPKIMLQVTYTEK